jgi:hypothetical protein
VHLAARGVWRGFEPEALRDLAFEPPMLEVGCGNGSFTALFDIHIQQDITSIRSIRAREKET